MIEVTMLANGIEDESLEGESKTIDGGIHQSAEIEVHVVQEGTIAHIALEALQPAGDVSNRQLEQTHA